MRKMRFAAAPVAAVAIAVSGVGAGAASATPLDQAGQGIQTGMGIGGMLGGSAGLLLGSAGDDLARYKSVPGVLFKVAGGAAGLIAALIPGADVPASPI